MKRGMLKLPQSFQTWSATYVKKLQAVNILVFVVASYGASSHQKYQHHHPNILPPLKNQYPFVHPRSVLEPQILLTLPFPSQSCRNSAESTKRSEGSIFGLPDTRIYHRIFCPSRSSGIPTRHLHFSPRSPVHCQFHLQTL
jgi:hypothetical protein